jgi:hypothetical protein
MPVDFGEKAIWLRMTLVCLRASKRQKVVAMDGPFEY